MSENEKLPPPVNFKHRLIGAVILVSAAVIFLPMIFSEREPPAELKAISEIPGKAGGPADVVPAPPSAMPPAPVIEPSVSEKKPAAEAKPSVPAASKTPAKATPAPAVPAKGWAVQVGVFANAANAAKLADKLKGQGYHVLTDNIAQGGEKRVRLRVGPFTDKAAAQQVQSKIQKANGIAGAVQAYP